MHLLLGNGLVEVENHARDGRVSREFRSIQGFIASRIAIREKFFRALGIGVAALASLLERDAEGKATGGLPGFPNFACGLARSEEHTSELQSLRHLVCRLLLEKK